MMPVWPTMKMDHLLGQSYIELHGNFANCESYFLAYHRAGEEPTQDMFLGGRYVDRLEKRGLPNTMSCSAARSSGSSLRTIR